MFRSAGEETMLIQDISTKAPTVPQHGHIDALPERDDDTRDAAVDGLSDIFCSRLAISFPGIAPQGPPFFERRIVPLALPPKRKTLWERHIYQEISNIQHHIAPTRSPFERLFLEWAKEQLSKNHGRVPSEDELSLAQIGSLEWLVHSHECLVEPKERIFSTRWRAYLRCSGATREQLDRFMDGLCRVRDLWNELANQHKIRLEDSLPEVIGRAGQKKIIETEIEALEEYVIEQVDHRMHRCVALIDTLQLVQQRLESRSPFFFYRAQVNFYERWSPYLVKEMVQGTDEKSHDLGNGVCDALSMRWVVQELKQPFPELLERVIKDLKIGIVEPHDRFNQAMLEAKRRHLIPIFHQTKKERRQYKSLLKQCRFLRQKRHKQSKLLRNMRGKTIGLAESEEVSWKVADVYFAAIVKRSINKELQQKEALAHALKKSYEEQIDFLSQSLNESYEPLFGVHAIESHTCDFDEDGPSYTKLACFFAKHDRFLQKHSGVMQILIQSGFPPLEMHAIFARLQPERGIYRVAEPNFGLFQFSTTTEFVQFLTDLTSMIYDWSEAIVIKCCKLKEKRAKPLCRIHSC